MVLTYKLVYKKFNRINCKENYTPLSSKQLAELLQKPWKG